MRVRHLALAGTLLVVRRVPPTADAPGSRDLSRDAVPAEVARDAGARRLP
jgi:hypothetical protein